MITAINYPAAPPAIYQPQTVGRFHLLPSKDQTSLPTAGARNLLAAAALALVLGIPALVYRKTLLSRISGIFNKEVLLPNVPAFSAHGLRPVLATARDIPEIATLNAQDFCHTSQQEINNFIHSIRNRTDAELKQYLKGVSKHDRQLRKADIDAHFPQFRRMMQDPKMLKALMDSRACMKDTKALESLLRARFIDNPDASLIVLKDRQGKIVAMEAINQFQATHDFHIDQGVLDSLDSKHGLATMLYVSPEYRNRGIATALKKQLIEYGRDRMGYRYIWSPAATENASYGINKKLGYKPLKPGTRFPDSPAFTPQRVKQLIHEYNTGSRRLTWIDSHKLKNA